MSPVGRRILVVEDNERVRGVIEETLAEEGFAVTAVADAAAALAALGQEDFALAVMEVSLPGPLDGIAAARRARLLHPPLKCLFTARFPPGSVWDNPDTDDFIARPFDRRELLGCVFELLQRGDFEGRAAAAGGVRDRPHPLPVAPSRQSS
ncbi:MAG TPA: response regulator [Stellaceae bacterium]|nr:response regulator [Stellaceae bacterium]